jgi:hypothetical protein
LSDLMLTGSFGRVASPGVPGWDILGVSHGPSRHPLMLVGLVGVVSSCLAQMFWIWFGLSNKNAQSARMCWVTLWGTMREIRQCQEVSGSTPWEWGTLHNQGSSLWRTLHIRCVFSFSNE